MAHILIYVSSANKIPLREGTNGDTGIFLGELTLPLMPLYEAGHVFTFITPDGKAPTIDQNSYHLLYWKFSKKKRNKAIHFLKTLESSGLNAPLKATEIAGNESQLESYSGLFIPGGHAPMTDIVFENWFDSNEFNRSTGEILSHFHMHRKPTAAICHGVAALAAAPEHGGKWLYNGYQMTCITMMAEWLAEDMPFFKTLKGHMRDYPTHMLQRKGAIIQQKNIPFLSQVVEDQELITAQDPFAAKELGKQLKIKIDNYLHEKK
ncbi:type 1 glutamine amidotransferase domain-containing protein [Legionella israelensis]|uniref:type 1 glutamine amidotransferase domain-containing protein n=1 Tax=Legionella israelensis TaxID=454 RepID=UPI00117C07C5|nr:type 1 glutamine amidotransferase domain-containing protein [Legionella israelensis]QDP72426.1 type 1 glutamine amidotransferase domain-containing protein [Legionella israelensis]